MKKVIQEIHKNRPDYDESTMIGDCWRACVASFLELPLHDVPHFAEIWENESQEKSINSYVSFLAKYGYAIRPVSVDKLTLDNCNPVIFENESPYYFVTGISPRDSKLYHLTIWKDGKMVHDPHPDNTGIMSVDYIEVLIKI